MFAHEKLKVYAKALAFASTASGLYTNWNKKHSVVDQLARASDSVVLNLAEGASLRSAPGKLRALDYALGSSLECAACMDIGRIKGFLSVTETIQEKQLLLEIFRMLIGLRKAWSTWRAQDETVPYRTASLGGISPSLFHHETLEVYAAALGVMNWLVSLPQTDLGPSRLYWQMDEAITGLILNIAEGNGRYSEMDHRRFLNIAEGSAVKAAAYLDLALQKGLLGTKDSSGSKELLERIVSMLSMM